MRWTSVIAVVMFALMVTMVSSASAEEPIVSPEGFHHESQLQVRATPVGLSVTSFTGYRFGLWGDAEGALLEDRYFDVGAVTALSPAYLWGGPYLEIEPVAVLNLQFSAQGLGYFGTFGHLYVPGEDPAAEPGMWNDDTLDRAWEEDLGQSTTGWKVVAQATPQIMLGRWVATAESSYRRINVDLEDSYYEPYYDLLLEPTEDMWLFRPTVGYLFGEDLEESHFLLGLRWERAIATRSEESRDTVAAVVNWGVPSEMLDWGSPSISGLAGAFIDHPTRGTVYPYFALQAAVQF